MKNPELQLPRIALSALALVAITGCDQNGSSTTATGPSTPQEAVATTEPAEPTPATATESPSAKDLKIATVESPAETEAPAAATTSIAATSTDLTAVKPSNGKATVGPTTAAAGPRDITTELQITLDPPRLDLGIMQPGVPKTGTVVMTNNGDTPIQIKKAVASCGCTTPKWPKEQIAPGESAELEITLKPSLKQGQRLSKRVTLQMVSGAPQIIPVEGEVGLFVAVEPNFLDASKKDIEGGGTIVLESADETPFSIIAADPPVVLGMGDEKSLVHTLTVDWDAWEQGGRRPSIKFTTDHPNAPELSMTVRRAIARNQPLPPSTLTNRPVASKLVSAAQGNDVEGVRRAIDAGDKIDGAAVGGMTALHWAAKNGNGEITAMLIEAGVDVNAGNTVGKTPLALAAESGQLEVLKTLVENGGEIDSVDEIGGTPLLWASALSNDPATVAFLIEAGADVNVVDTNGMTPLIWAAGIGQPESVSLLLEKGADMEIVEIHQKETALMRAARIGKAESLDRILAANPELETANRLGQTAAMIAAASAPLEKLKALVEAGADLGVRDTRGWSTLDHARARTDANRTEIIEFLESNAPAEIRDADPIVGG